MIPSPLDTLAKDGSDPLTDLASRRTNLGQQFEDATFVEEVTGGVTDRKFADELALGPNLSDAALLSVTREMHSMTTLEQTAWSAWERSYRAYRSEHSYGSKYLTRGFVNRSKVFRPKTRAAVRKNQAAAAQALFSTVDPIKIQAQDDDNPLEAASAAIKQELVNYRLSRAATHRNGIPWFLVAMGAHQDAQVTGICASKQMWRFKETELPPVQTIDDRTGEHLAPSPSRIVEFDRPDIQNIPPENLRVDSGAEWTNPAQTASRLAVEYPMSVEDAFDLIQANNGNSAVRWREITIGELKSASTNSGQTLSSSVRRAREGGVDRQTETAGAVRQVWLIENFARIDGDDWCWWTLGTTVMLSDPMRTREAYPAMGGDRPIVIGYGSLEAHRIFPTSTVESLGPMQMELNDIVNNRLDQMKELVRPTRKVVRGRNIDTEALKVGGNSGIVMVNAPEDVSWDRPPDVPASAYQETNYLNADFDSLAGAFDTGSVQTNRKLNETVGGMKMMAGSAGVITQFDLRVWSETWVEPVLRQLVKLEEHYESDVNVLALAGNKAQLFQRFGVSEITDELLRREVTTRVDAGLGSASPDPMERIQKLQMASKAVVDFATPFFEAGLIEEKVTPRIDEFAAYVFAAIDIRDGDKRFFNIAPKPDTPPPPDPKVQLEQAKLQQKDQDGQRKAAVDAQKIASQERIEGARLQDKAQDREARLIAEAEKTRREQTHRLLMQRDSQLHQTHESRADRLLDLLLDSRQRTHDSWHRDRDRKVVTSASQRG